MLGMTHVCFFLKRSERALVAAGIEKLQLLDAGFFAYQIAQVVQTCPAYPTALHHLDTGDVWVGVGKDAFDAYTVGNFAHRKRAGQPVAFDLNDIAAKILFARFVAFHDAVFHHNRVAGFKCWELRGGEQLAMYKLDGFQFFHDIP